MELLRFHSVQAILAECRVILKHAFILTVKPLPAAFALMHLIDITATHACPYWQQIFINAYVLPI